MLSSVDLIKLFNSLDNLGKNILLKPVNNEIDTSKYTSARFAVIKYETQNYSHDANIFILPNSENHSVMISGSPYELETVDIVWNNNRIYEYWHYSFIKGNTPRMQMTQAILFF